MPTLDVSEAFDPLFMDDFVVISIKETLVRGRATRAEFARSATGVVVPASPNDLERLPEGEFMNKALSITTQHPIQGPSDGYAGDEILWNNSRFVVRDVADYSRYGRGFINAIAVSIQAIDPPPMPEPAGHA